MPPVSNASFACHVLPATSCHVVEGANHGDPLGAADALCLGDVYRVTVDAPPLRLCVAHGGGGRVLGTETQHRVAEGSDVGPVGATLSAEARLRFLAAEGHAVSLLLLRVAPETWVLLPIDPVSTGMDLTLAGIERAPAGLPLADAVATGFARGTALTLADGRQRAIEDIKPGDLVLTRDNGAQPLRTLLPSTRRAVGSHAPVVLRQGALGNAADLVLAQDQRLFVYQRGLNRLTERAEMLLRAGHLVDGDAVRLREGGFTDYLTPVFDQHEVVYAECVPVESLQVSAATRDALPRDLVQDLASRMPGLDHRPPYAQEAPADLALIARSRLLRSPPE